MRFPRVASRAALVALWTLAGLPAAAQDDCVSATPISAPGSYLWATFGFTDSGVDPGAPCFPADGSTQGGPAFDYWFAWTVAGPGDWRLDTAGGGVDTVIQVSTGPCGTESCVAYDDNGAGNFESRVDLFGLGGGESYLVQVGTWQNDTSVAVEDAGFLNVGLVPPPPANDSCASPDVLTLSGLGSFPWSNAAATTSGFTGASFPCPSATSNLAPRLDVFFTFTAPADDSYRFDTLGSNTNTILQVHVGSDCAATCLAYNDNGGGSAMGESAAVLPDVTAGEIFLVQVGLWRNVTETSFGVLNVSAFTPPSNDTCASPAPIGLGGNVWDNSQATDSGFRGVAEGAPTGAALPRNDLFLSFTAPLAGTYQFDTLGTGFDTVLNLYDGADCAAVYLQNSDDEGSSFGESRVFLLDALAGQVVLLQVGSRMGQETGFGILSVSQLPDPPPGNTCDDPLAIGGLGSWAFDTTGMTTEGFGDGAGVCPVGFVEEQPKQDLFLVWTSPAAGAFQFDTLGSGADTVVVLHLGADCAATCVAYSQDDLPRTGASRAAVGGLAPGDQVLVQIGSWGHVDIPSGVLNVSALPAVTNDTCATPTVIAGEGAWSFDFLHPDLGTSGFDGGDPGSCFSSLNPFFLSDLAPMEPDVFFAWTASCPGDHRFTTDPTPGSENTKLSVHLGGDCSAVCLASNDNILAHLGNFLSEVVITGVVPGDTYLVQAGLWHATTVRSHATLTIERVGGGCGAGTSLSCTPAAPHSGGGAATLAGSFLGATSASGLHLEASGGKPGEFAFFLVSADASAEVPVFDGVLCLGGAQGRYNPVVAANQGLPQLDSLGQFDAQGVLQNLVGTAASGSGFDVPLALPFAPAGQQISPGDVWHFQGWFRDGASANFTDVVSVTFP